MHISDEFNDEDESEMQRLAHSQGMVSAVSKELTRLLRYTYNCKLIETQYAYKNAPSFMKFHAQRLFCVVCE